MQIKLSMEDVTNKFLWEKRGFLLGMFNTVIGPEWNKMHSTFLLLISFQYTTPFVEAKIRTREGSDFPSKEYFYVSLIWEIYSPSFLGVNFI